MTTLGQRFQEILTSKEITPKVLPKDKDELDFFCDYYKLNFLEKAYIQDLNVHWVFSNEFIKGFKFLEFADEEGNNIIWKKILRLS